jgi:NADP-dependent 3-hydroxy acid dehydrogenase YdfG
MEIKMKTAMIFGASGGIGSAIGRELKSMGMAVVAGVRDTESDLTFADLVIQGDFARDAEAKRMVREAAEEIERIDLWVYAAGDIGYAKIGEGNSASWDQIIGANITGAHHTLSASVPLLAEDAHVMFIGAYTDRLLMPGLAAYTASKAALAAYSAVVEKELRGKKVVLIRPAAVDTPFWKKVPFKLPANAMRPEAIAEKVHAAYVQGLTGLVDL